jgi:hypothetical protein
MQESSPSRRPPKARDRLTYYLGGDGGGSSTLTVATLAPFEAVFLERHNTQRWALFRRLDVAPSWILEEPPLVEAEAWAINGPGPPQRPPGETLLSFITIGTTHSF